MFYTLRCIITLFFVNKHKLILKNLILRWEGSGWIHNGHFFCYEANCKDDCSIIPPARSVLRTNNLFKTELRHRFGRNGFFDFRGMRNSALIPETSAEIRNYSVISVFAEFRENPTAAPLRTKLLFRLSNIKYLRNCSRVF